RRMHSKPDGCMSRSSPAPSPIELASLPPRPPDPPPAPPDPPPAPPDPPPAPPDPPPPPPDPPLPLDPPLHPIPAAHSSTSAASASMRPLPVPSAAQRSSLTTGQSSPTDHHRAKRKAARRLATTGP